MPYAFLHDNYRLNTRIRIICEGCYYENSTFYQEKSLMRRGLFLSTLASFDIILNMNKLFMNTLITITNNFREKSQRYQIDCKK